MSLLLFFACWGKASTAHPVSSVTPPTEQAEPAPVDDVVDPVAAASRGCSDLDEAACFESAECMVALEPGAKTYTCRAASGPCEAGFVQADTSTCPVERDCELVPASCYCPPTVLCICGGGEPPGCAGVERRPPAAAGVGRTAATGSGRLGAPQAGAHAVHQAPHGVLHVGPVAGVRHEHHDHVLDEGRARRPGR